MWIVGALVMWAVINIGIVALEARNLGLVAVCVAVGAACAAAMTRYEARRNGPDY